jgi:hypothetical protein
LRRQKPKRLPCFAFNCCNTRPIWHFFCEECFERLPAQLRIAIAKEKERCRQLRLYHTQELLSLRDRAYSELRGSAS